MHRIISSYHRYDVFLPSVASTPFRLLSKSGRNNISPSRFFLQKRYNSNNSLKDIYGLPFTISPERALEKFEKWARNDQGLNTFIMNWNNVRIAAAYTPVWSFTLNIRFVLINNNDKEKTKAGRASRRLDWMPSMFQEAYGTNQYVVHVPGLSAYAGHSYRRSLIEPLHNTTLVFLGEEAVPFGSWMMKDMKLGNKKLAIFPDPLNATRGKAFAIVKENLKLLCLSSNNFPSNEYNLELQTEIISSRRVYMPTYVIDYKVIPNMEFQAFVSGCDEAADVSGVSHKMVRDNDILAKPQQMQQNASSFLNQASSLFDSGTRLGRNLGLGNREFGTIIVLFLQFVGSFAVRILARIPIIGLFVGLLFGFRKVIQPWMDSRSASVEWERQREHEATINVDYKDDFVDSGNAQRYYNANRKRILNQLSGNANHTRGDFDWYQKWEAWARQQWDEQQKQQQQQSPHENTRRQQQQTQQNQRSTRPMQNTDYKWDFDPNDP